MEIFIQENAFEQGYHTDFKTKWHHITDNFFEFIFLDKDCWALIQIWLKLVPKGPIGIKPALVQIMAWWWTAEKPLTESVMSYVTDAKMRHLVSMSQNTEIWWNMAIYSKQFIQIFWVFFFFTENAFWYLFQFSSVLIGSNQQLVSISLGNGLAL